MNTNDALNILNLSDTTTQAQVKAAYKKACLKYHPDRNPAGAEMMKAVNAAYELLQNKGDTITADAGFNGHDFGAKLNEVLMQLFELDGIEIEVCGNWIWVGGDTKPHAKRLGRREGGIGLYFSKKKSMWYYRPAEYKSRSRQSLDIDQIREKHGSRKPGKTHSRKQLKAA